MRLFDCAELNDQWLTTECHAHIQLEEVLSNEAVYRWFPYNAITDTYWSPNVQFSVFCNSASTLERTWNINHNSFLHSGEILEYVSTVPGFQSLHWVPVSHSPSQCIIFLIQWDSGLAWKRFQFSMGFSMLLGYLSLDLFNRCPQLSLPFDPVNLDYNLKSASSRLSHNPTNLPSGVSEYEEKSTAQWDTILCQVMKDSNVNIRLITSTKAGPRRSTKPEEEYKTEDGYFTGFSLSPFFFFFLWK